jgi:hypothetical protein
MMSDYRNPNDPFPSDMRDPDARSANAAWGWIAGAVFVVIVLAVAFGIGHQPNQPGTDTLANNAPPPAASKITPPLAPAPAGPANPGLAPTPGNPDQPNPAKPQ